MGWAEHVAYMGEMRNAYNILTEKPEGKGPLGRHRNRWEDNITKDLREKGWMCRLDSSGSEQGPVAGSCQHSIQPSGPI